MQIEGYQLVALLMAAGIVLMIGEMLLPTHGLLGIAGAGAILWAIFVCARQNSWAGLGLLLACVAATPLVWNLFVKVWPKTPIGRRLILQQSPAAPEQLAVRVGQTGVTVSELRPMGMCDFAGVRVESISEHGIVPPGAQVTVVALVNQRPTVRIT